MRVGLYFSPRDWWWAANRPELTGTPEQKTNLAAYVSGQLGELCTRYGQLDLLWFDGGVGREAEMYRDIIGPKQPRVITNDRNGPGDYATPEGQVPSRPLFNADGTDRIWESCIPMGNGGWSYHNDTVEPFNVLIRQMVEVLAKGGNLLRNIGPQPNGEWSPAVRERILQIGEWLKVNGESVYGTHRTRLGWQPWGWATANSNTLFLHVTLWPGRELRLEGLNDHVATARLLQGCTALEFAQAGSMLTIALPVTAPDPVDTVIALSIDNSSLPPAVARRTVE
jgi:alpha-L-fucosidase